VWSEECVAPAVVGFLCIFANRYTVAGNWEGARLIDAPSPGISLAPRLAIAATGAATAIWARGDTEIWANQWLPHPR